MAVPSSLRLSIRVRPGASRTRVGGQYGDDSMPGGVALCIAVTARAVDGAANEAVRRALADALGVRARDIRLLMGERSRSKVVEVEGDPAGLEDQVARLLAL